MMELSYQSTLSEKEAVGLKQASVQYGPRTWGWLWSDPSSSGDWGVEPLRKPKEQRATAGRGGGGRVTRKLQLEVLSALTYESQIQAPSHHREPTEKLAAHSKVLLFHSKAQALCCTGNVTFLHAAFTDCVP